MKIYIKFNATSLGVMTLSKWCESMEAATKLGLPWRLLREKLAPPDIDQSPTEVTYRRTLDMLEDDLIVSAGCRIDVVLRWAVTRNEIFARRAVKSELRN